MEILLSISVCCKLRLCFSQQRQFQLSQKSESVLSSVPRRTCKCCARGQLLLKLLLESIQHDKQINLFNSELMKFYILESVAWRVGIQ